MKWISKIWLLTNYLIKAAVSCYQNQLLVALIPGTGILNLRRGMGLNCNLIAATREALVLWKVLLVRFSM